jgi:hypothetical protein
MKVLKKDISHLKKDIDEAFGLSKIIQLENKVSELTNERISLE